MIARQEEAIVLKSQPYGEADLIVSLWTREEGRLRGIAKGARRSRKRFVNALEPGAWIDILFEEKAGRELFFLKEASLKTASPPWRGSLAAILSASFAIEMALRLLPEQNPAAEKFDLLKAFLNDLREETALRELLKFEFRWLSLSGLEPNLNFCGVCLAPLETHPRWQVLLEKGEILCPKCLGGKESVLSFKDILFLKGVEAEKEKIDLGRIQSVFDLYWLSTLGRPFASRKLLSQLFL